MIEDDVLREIRAVREAYAELHHFDVRAMIADLQARNLADDRPVVHLPPRRPEQSDVPVRAPSPEQGSNLSPH